MRFLSSQLLVGEVLKTVAHWAPQKTAYVYEDQKLTYRELLARSTQLAAWLQQHGISKDDKVGFVCKNSLSFVELYFGVSLTNGVGVPVNFRLTGSEMEYILNHSDSKILFIDQEYVETIQTIREKLPQVEKIVVIDNTQELADLDMIAYETIFETRITLTPDETMVDNDSHLIVYTSGTTGKPKGAVLSHKNLVMNAMNRFAHMKGDGDVRQLIVPPLFHIASLCLLVTNCLQEGTGYIHRDFQPEKILQTIQEEKINNMMLVPAMWNFLTQVPHLQQYDLRSMRRCSMGGSIAPIELKYRILEVFSEAELFEAFGQTEMSPVTTNLLPEDTIRKTASVGLPSMNVRVRVVDEEMRDVPIGEVGEIVYQGPTMMKEYYKNPEATREAFKGGWFHSGDLVRMDDEGFIYIVDRKKDMIISGGENIYPAEVEAVLYSHPAVLEAAVIGVPDPKWGETVKAYVVLKANQQLTSDEVIEHCRTRIASYKKPRYVEFLKALPRNASGKVLKTTLRKLDEEKNATDVV